MRASPACRPSRPKQRVADVGLDDRQALHGARHRHVQRVDVELVQLQRLVALVPGAAVVEFVALQVLACDAVAHLGVGRALPRHHAHQQHVRVLQALGLVHREDQRRAESAPAPRPCPRRAARSRRGVPRRAWRRRGAAVPRPLAWTSVTSPAHRKCCCTRKLLSRSIEPKRACLIFSSVLASCGHRLRVAEVGLQHLQLLALRGLAGQALPEQASSPPPS